MSTKTVVKWFDITMHEEEREWLREMHKQGWKLQCVRGVIFTFASCEPEDVVYQLDYHSELEDKSDYLQMFMDCGWEYIQDMMGYSYFRKPAADMNGEESIFCDHESRMEMWDRVFKGRVRLMMIMLICVIIPQLLIQSHNTSLEGDFLHGVFIGLVFVYLVIFIRFTKRYKQAKGKQ